jgi:N-acetylglucosaminyldiphosphoundecaprenol N-acetyl-beta-D-mannosaminyltransferase
MNKTPHARKAAALGTRDTGAFLGIHIDQMSLAEVTEDALQAIKQNISQRVFVCANPHSLVVAQRDSNFLSALMHADRVVADGVGVSFMARLVGVQIGPRITGTDYFFAVLMALQQRGGGRIFFFGSSQRVLDLIAQRLARDFPALTLCGVYSPPFGSWSEFQNRRMVQIINTAKPDVLWVGMTAPKQEKWVEENRHSLAVPVIASIGAVFDFYAGTYARAPQWVCQIGFEWAYRFILEPRRMWQRNCVSAPKFLWLVFCRHILGTRKSLGQRLP